MAVSCSQLLLFYDFFCTYINLQVDYFVSRFVYNIKTGLVLGLQQQIDKIYKNRLLKALATNLVIDSLSRAINTSLVGAALFTASRRQVGSWFMHAHSEL